MPIFELASTVTALRRVSGAEEAGVLVWAGAQHSWWRSCLAVWFAALLAIAPLASPSLPDTVSLAGISVDSVAPGDQGLDSPAQPTSGVRPAQPLALGALARPSLLEKTLGLSKVKSPGLDPGSDHDLLLGSSATGGSDGETRQILHRSSIGSARVPTGPPL